MKTNKYIAIAALSLGFSAPTMAQNVQGDIDQIAKVIKDHKGSLEVDPAKSQIKDWYKAHKKDAKALAGLGQAYFDIKDTMNAKKYANEAIKRDNHCGDGYILLGDIQAMASNDGGEAAVWYQNAKTMDPKNPKGYVKYAYVYRAISPKEAVQSLEELRNILPDYPVDAEVGQIYYNKGQFKEALESFNKVKDLSKLDKNYLSQYTGAAYFAGDNDKSIEVAEYGLQKFNNEPNFLRMGFYNNLVKKNYTEAKEYADKLIAAADTAVTAMDYANYGHVCNGLKDYAAAAEWFKKSLAKDDSDNDIRKYIREAYAELGDLANAEAAHKDYVDHKKQKSNEDLSELAEIYTTAARNQQDKAKKEELLLKADAVYDEYIKQYPTLADYGLYMRAKVNENRDPDYTKGTAKPYWDELIKVVTSHTEKGGNDDAYLKQAYFYMGAYFYTAGKQDEGNVFWKKLLELDPNNATAKQCLGIQ